MSRIERFTAALSDAGMAAALIMNPPDVYYLSGTGQPCNLLVTPGGEPVLFARRYLELAQRASHVERVLPGAGFSAVAREARLGDGPLGMELDKVPAALVDRAAGTLSSSIPSGPSPSRASRATAEKPAPGRTRSTWLARCASSR